MKTIYLYIITLIVSTFFSGILSFPVTLLVGGLLKSLRLPNLPLAFCMHLSEGFFFFYLMSIFYSYNDNFLGLWPLFIMVIGFLIFGLQRLNKYQNKELELISLFSQLAGLVIGFFVLS